MTAGQSDRAQKLAELLRSETDAEKQPICNDLLEVATRLLEATKLERQNLLLASANELRAAQTFDEAWSDTQPEGEPYRTSNIQMLRDMVKALAKATWQHELCMMDFHDTLTSIDLETGHFNSAVEHAEQGLALKLSLYARDSEPVADGYYMLSKALWMMVQRAPSTHVDGVSSYRREIGGDVDAMRKRVTEQTETAISLNKARLEILYKMLPTVSSAKKAEWNKRIAIRKMRTEELKARLDVLRGPDTEGVDVEQGDGTKLIASRVRSRGCIRGKSVEQIKQRRKLAGNASGRTQKANNEYRSSRCDHKYDLRSTKPAGKLVSKSNTKLSAMRLTKPG